MLTPTIFVSQERTWWHQSGHKLSVMPVICLARASLFSLTLTT